MRIRSDRITDDEISMFLNKMYESEINVGLEGFWDGGWTARIGDFMNGYRKEESGFETLGQAVTWLSEEILVLYPNSTFTKWWNK